MAGCLIPAGGLAGFGLPALTSTQYIEQLQRYENQVAELSSSPQNAVALRDSIPEALTVQTVVEISLST